MSMTNLSDMMTARGSHGVLQEFFPEKVGLYKHKHPITISITRPQPYTDKDIDILVDEMKHHLHIIIPKHHHPYTTEDLRYVIQRSSWSRDRSTGVRSCDVKYFTFETTPQ